MERAMRRSRQVLDRENVCAILDRAGNGVLSLVDDTGAPYGVPLSYAYDGEDRIYFHCAKSGYKLECIEAESRCSFCVVGQDLVMPEEFTTYFRSVIVAGRISVVTDSDEIQLGLKLLCDKYSPGVDTEAELSRFLKHVVVLRLDIEGICGKEAIELVRQRQSAL